jgi:hypothetical protein
MKKEINVFLSFKATEKIETSGDISSDQIEPAVGKEFATHLYQALKDALPHISFYFSDDADHSTSDFGTKIKNSINEASFFVLVLGKRSYWEWEDTERKKTNWLKHEWESYNANVNTPNSPYNKPLNSFVLVYNKNLKDGGFNKMDFLPKDLTAVQNIGFDSKVKNYEAPIKEVINVISNFYKNNPKLVKDLEYFFKKADKDSNLLANEKMISLVNNSKSLKTFLVSINKEYEPLKKIPEFTNLLGKHDFISENEMDYSCDAEKFSKVFDLPEGTNKNHLEDHLTNLRKIRVKVTDYCSVFISPSHDNASDKQKNFFDIINVIYKDSGYPDPKISLDYSNFVDNQDFIKIINYFTASNKVPSFQFVYEVRKQLNNLISNIEKQLENIISSFVPTLSFNYFFVKNSVYKSVIKLIKNSNDSTTLGKKPSKTLSKSITAEIKKYKKSIKSLKGSSKKGKYPEFEVEFSNVNYSIKIIKYTFFYTCITEKSL